MKEAIIHFQNQGKLLRITLEKTKYMLETGLQPSMNGPDYHALLGMQGDISQKLRDFCERLRSESTVQERVLVPFKVPFNMPFEEYQKFLHSLSSHTLFSEQDKDLIQNLTESNVSPDMLSQDKVVAFNEMIGNLVSACDDEIDRQFEAAASKKPVDEAGKPLSKQTTQTISSDEVQSTVQNGGDYFKWMTETMVGSKDE